MIIIRENKDFSYSIEELDIAKDNQGNDINVYQFGLVLKVFNNQNFTILLEYDMVKKTLKSICIQNQENMTREEMNLAYTYVIMLREELKSHMKYMLSLH